MFIIYKNDCTNKIMDIFTNYRNIETRLHKVNTVSLTSDISYKIELALDCYRRLASVI